MLDTDMITEQNERSKDILSHKNPTAFLNQIIHLYLFAKPKLVSNIIYHPRVPTFQV